MSQSNTQRGGGRGRGRGPTPPIGNNRLPDRIQCSSCNRFLMPGRYSNRQLDEYRTELRRNRSNPANARRPICMNCTGRPATELKCAQCDITKGLDAFTKAQRRDPDNARCKDCVQDNVDELPNAEDRLAELKIRDETERGGSKQGSAFSTTASLPGFGNGGSRVGTSLNGSGSQVQDQGDGVWIPRDTGSGINYGSMQNPANRTHGHCSASTSSASTNLSGRTTSSGASTAWGGFLQQPRPHRNASSNTSSVNGSTSRGTNPGFANIGADWRHQTPAQRAEVTRQREERRQLEAQQNLRDEDEDGSDSEWEL